MTKRKTAVSIIAVIVIGAVAVMAFVSYYAAVLYKQRRGEPAPITYGQYLQLHDGMTMDEVVAVLGRKGKEISSSDMENGILAVMGRVTTVYVWVNPDGSKIKCTFQNCVQNVVYSRLKAKAQSGLR